MTNAAKKVTSSSARRKVIMELLKEDEFVSSQEILKVCDVSEITVRRDLTELEKKGLLIRTHGGAIKSKTTDNLFLYNKKVREKSVEKDYVAQIASQFVNPNDVVFIDCGSTVSFLTKYLVNIEPLTVVTNSLPVVSELMNFDHIKLILVGGEIDKKRRAMYGNTAVQNIKLYHANKAFIGVDGISLLSGLTSFNEKAASITLKMAENSDEVFLLCDSSKIEKDSFVKFAPLSTVDYVVTDKKVDRSFIPKYKKQHISLVCEV